MYSQRLQKVNAIGSDSDMKKKVTPSTKGENLSMSTIRLNLFGITMLAFVLLALAVAPTVGEASVKVTVTPEEVYEGDIVDVTVTYEITKDFTVAENFAATLVISLPTNWVAAYDDETSLGAGGSFDTSNALLYNAKKIRENPNTTSYVVLKKSFRNAGLYTGDGLDTVVR